MKYRVSLLLKLASFNVAIAQGAEICTETRVEPQYKFKNVKTFDLSGASGGGPNQGFGGAIWVGMANGILQRRTKDGDFVENYQLDGGISARPTVINSGPYAGSVIVGTDRGSLYMYDYVQNKLRKLDYLCGEPVLKEPLVRADGSFVVLGSNGSLSFYKSDGTPEADLSNQPKVVRLNEHTSAGLVLLKDEKMGVPTASGKLIILERDGQPSLSADGRPQVYYAGSAIVSTPTVDSLGSIVFGTMNGDVHSVNQNATEASAPSPVGGHIRSSVGVIPGDNVRVVPTDDSLISFLNADGSRRATYSVEVGCSSDVTIKGGHAYVGCNDGSLYVFNAKGELEAKLETSSEIVGAPLVATSGKIFFSNLDPRGYVADLDFKQVAKVDSKQILVACVKDAGPANSSGHYKKSQ